MRAVQFDALSVYVHIPFCASPCFYCACNRIITRSVGRAVAYLDRLHREINLQAELFQNGRCIEQLHFGGGTPTFLSTAQLATLLEHLDKRFALGTSPEREYSIEIDPRTVTPESVHELAKLGFNRMSLGIQDFDEAVQRAVNRLQLLGLTIERLTQAGYVYIGMNHFALPHDELVRAQAERTLQRNFQGYSTRAQYDLVGLGVSAIGKVGDAYAQSHKLLKDYYTAIDGGHLAIQRGLVLHVRSPWLHRGHRCGTPAHAKRGHGIRCLPGAAGRGRVFASHLTQRPHQ